MITEPVEQAKTRKKPLGGRFESGGESLDELRAQAAREREAAEAGYEALAAAAGHVPGSVAELRLSDKQGYYGWWVPRNLDLIEDVRSGKAPCCGEWQHEGYYGWCSLLGRPVDVIEIPTPNGGLVRERCDRCPRAIANREMSAWFALWLSEIELICNGEIDV